MVYWRHLVAGAIRYLQDVLLLIGGLISFVGGILMMLLTFFILRAPARWYRDGLSRDGVGNHSGCCLLALGVISYSTLA